MTEKLSGDRIWKSLHKVPDEWLWSRLPQWIQDYAPHPKWWLVALRSSGLFWYYHKGNLTPNMERIQLARDVVTYLNATTNYGGAWVAAWIYLGSQQMPDPKDETKTREFQILRFYLLWKDRDGDAHTDIEVDFPMVQLRQWKMEDFKFLAEQALTTAFKMRAAVEWRPDQLKKLAQGEPLAERVH